MSQVKLNRLTILSIKKELLEKKIDYDKTMNLISQNTRRIYIIKKCNIFGEKFKTSI